jgi:hypothetical protein
MEELLVTTPTDAKHKLRTNLGTIHKIKYSKDRTPRQTADNKFTGTRVLTTS